MYSVVASWLKHAPCIARVLSVLSVVCGFMYITPKKKVEKKSIFLKKGHELCEARIHAIKSKIGHRDHLTILPKILFFFFSRRAADARHTARMAQHAQHSTAKERETVMTDDGSQAPIEQLATAIHRGSATRSWCGPVLLVCAAIIGVVVMLLVFSACCLMSRFLP